MAWLFEVLEHHIVGTIAFGLVDSVIAEHGRYVWTLAIVAIARGELSAIDLPWHVTDAQTAIARLRAAKLLPVKGHSGSTQAACGMQVQLGALVCILEG